MLGRSEILLHLLPGADGLFELESNLRLQIFGSLRLSGLPRPLGIFFELLDLGIQVSAFCPPLIARSLEVFFELLLLFLHVFQLQFVLRLDLLDQLLRRAFRPRDRIKIDRLVLALEFGATHLGAFEPRGFCRIE